ncbi:MAG: site-2 protease family protein [Myxococcales bacterium]|nr:site-2 protease family protein [Myxococcales bacterium]
MRWSWKLVRLAGIDVYVHATFLMLLAWIGFVHWRTGGMQAAAAGVALIAAAFGTIVLHELGHALVARRFGIRTRDITLWPIGGIARLERMPEKPEQELLVSVAGPAVNAAIAVVLGATVLVMGLSVFPESLAGGGIGSFITKLFWINLVIALFNLLPAFPMDGGRVLRALLAMRGDYVKATRTAATIGQGFALLLGLVGLFTNPLLIFIALFLWMGAAAESGAVQLKGALVGVPVHVAMQTEYRALSPDTSLGDAARTLLAGSQTEFPVIGATPGRVLGVVTRSSLVAGLAARGQGARVDEIMNVHFAIAEPYESLDAVLGRIEESGCQLVPVLHQGRLAGIVTSENISELILLRGAIEVRQSRVQGLSPHYPRAA